jgi:hypothetical protein
VQGGFNISGIYLDEGSDLITVRDNVLQNAGDAPIFQNANGPSNAFSRNAGTSPTVIASAGAGLAGVARRASGWPRSAGAGGLPGRASGLAASGRRSPGGVPSGRPC